MNLTKGLTAAWAATVLIAASMAALVMPAQAATPSCGPKCLDVFSKQFGTFSHPQFVFDTYKQGQVTGVPVILFRTSNSDPAEDFTIANEGPVSDFLQAGLVSTTLALHYGCDWNVTQGKCTNSSPDDYAFELEYAPFGVDSGLCPGVAAVATAGEKITLQPCGTSAKTVWVADTLDSCPANPLYKFEVPAINGSDTNFSHPFVLTYPGSGYPTDNPRPQLYVTNLNGFSQSGNGKPCGLGSIVGANSNQLWAARQGVLP